MSTIALKIETLLKRTNSFIRFLLVGVVNTLTGLSMMFMCLNILEWPYWGATFFGNGVGALVSYMLNRSFTFRSKVDLKKGAIRFIIVVLLCYWLSFSTSELIVIWIFQQFETFSLLQPNEFAILIGSGFYTVSNYFGQKYFVF
jgi:putative flippase GtrA